MVATRPGLWAHFLSGPKWKYMTLQWVVWSERRDLNSGPPVPQTGALTGLRYAPNIGPHYSQRGLALQHAPAWPRRTAHYAAP